jgi:opacity protein-like surface antigen
MKARQASQLLLIFIFASSIPSLALARVRMHLGLGFTFAQSVTLNQKYGASNLNSSAEGGLDWQAGDKSEGFGLGISYLSSKAGTAEIKKEENPGELQNFSISPQGFILTLLYEFKMIELYLSGFIGTASARIVQNRVGFDYKLTSGWGIGAGAQKMFPLFGNFGATVDLGYEFFEFRKQTIQNVDSTIAPHSGVWRTQGTKLGLGLAWKVF